MKAKAKKEKVQKKMAAGRNCVYSHCRAREREQDGEKIRGIKKGAGGRPTRI